MPLGLSIPDHVVPYCERIVTGTEIFNTGSNVAFFFAAVYGTFVLTPQRAAEKLLVLLTFFVGLGSMLFHAVPGFITHLLDVVPVVLFALLLMVMILRRAGWGRTKIQLVMAIWLVVSGFASMWPDVLARSLFYLPTVLLLFGLSMAVKLPGQSLQPMAVLFTIALLARSADLPLCGYVPIGTHVLWHLLNAVVCVMGLRLAIPQTD